MSRRRTCIGHPYRSVASWFACRHPMWAYRQGLITAAPCLRSCKANPTTDLGNIQARVSFSHQVRAGSPVSPVPWIPRVAGRRPNISSGRRRGSAVRSDQIDDTTMHHDRAITYASAESGLKYAPHIGQLLARPKRPPLQEGQIQ